MTVPKKAKTAKVKKAGSVAKEPSVAYIAAKGKKTKAVKPLTAADWVRPGRPATDEEMEQLLQEILSEKGGISTEELRKKVLTWGKKK